MKTMKTIFGTLVAVGAVLAMCSDWNPYTGENLNEYGTLIVSAILLLLGGVPLVFLMLMDEQSQSNY